jgi:chemotaxis protein methyltransferase CheR
MTSEPNETERFRAVIRSRFGLHFDEARRVFLDETLRHRAKICGKPVAAYLGRLETAGISEEEMSALAEAVTVSETYFFRHYDQFRAFSEIARAEQPGVRTERRGIQILSAGCASGEEAYSLAILLREHAPGLATEESRIQGFDINPAVVEKAIRGRYSKWSLRETPPEHKRRWFARDGKEFVLDEAVRKMATFERRNLVDDDPGYWKSVSFDVIFCRNVIMYLSTEHARALVTRLTRALTPGGFLFLGHAETLRGLSQNFHLRHTHDTFYYQRRKVLEPEEYAVSAPLRTGYAKTAVAFPVESIPSDTSWVDAIQRAVERIQSLTDPRPARAAVSASASRGESVAGWDLAPALDLFRHERFGEALALVTALPAASTTSPDVMLLRASLLTHSGRLDDAEKACAELLAVDELSAGAHYLMALCREHAGDAQGAIERDKAAAYLDPGFAMPRLHMGLMARRAGNPDAARRELRQAVTLIQGEDPSRMMLFGGGFGREALIALCRSELAMCGGTD